MYNINIGHSHINKFDPLQLYPTKFYYLLANRCRSPFSYIGSNIEQSFFPGIENLKIMKIEKLTSQVSSKKKILLQLQCAYFFPMSNLIIFKYPKFTTLFVLLRPQ